MIFSAFLASLTPEQSGWIACFIGGFAFAALMIAIDQGNKDRKASSRLFGGIGIFLSAISLFFAP